MRLVSRVLDRLTRPPILAAFAILCGLSVAVVGIAYLRNISGPVEPGTAHVVTGDYLAFLTGARVLADGNGASLYDLDAQYAVQTRLAGTALPAWQPYVNPPLFAVLLRPLARLPFVTGFYIYAAAMIALGLLAALALVGLAPRLSRGRLDAATLVVLALAFHPIARTMFGGQNTVLTWALVTGALWALQSNRSIVAGLCVAFLSYKPQYVPLLFAALVLSRAWTAAAVAVVGIFVHYLMGAAFIGADWPLRLAAAMRLYRPMEAVNIPTHFSLLPFFQHAFGGRLAPVLALVSAAGVLVALARFAPRARPGDANFPLTWALLLVTAMLLSPHLQYYDFGLLVLPVVIALDSIVRDGRAVALSIRLAIAAVYAAYPVIYETHRLFQPLTVVTVIVFAWLCWLGRGARLRAAARPAAPSP